MSDGCDLCADDLFAPVRAKPLRVLTYNIKGGEGSDGRMAIGKRDYLALEHVASLIESLAPDLVALQEIAVVCSQGGVADQVACLAARLGMHHAFGPVAGGTLLVGGRAAGRDFWGNAILSRFPIEAFRIYEFQSGRPRDARCLLETRLQIGGRTVTFASVHLSYIWRTNFAQSRELAALASAARGPYIVAGDFNAAAGSAELSPVHAVLRDAFSAAGLPFGHPLRCTFPDGPRRCRDLDHIFFSDDVTVAACAVQVDENGVSDHNPVVADLWLPRADGDGERGQEALADDLFA